MPGSAVSAPLLPSALPGFVKFTSA